MSDAILDEESIDKAVAMFESAGLNSPEALLASARLFTASLARLQAEAREIRTDMGEVDIRRFATEHLNEVIYDIQDTIPVAVRLFNSFMRDPTDEKAGPSE